MSLRGALANLPDDRATRSAARSVVSFIAHHVDEPLEQERIARVTGVSIVTVEQLIKALADGYVIDCGGPGTVSCIYHPSTVLGMEVDRYLRTSSVVDQSLRKSTDRFRSQYGR